jgi:sugar phosphate isomerase/epimerase
MQQTRMARLAVSEVSTLRWTFEEDVLRYADLGYSAMGIWRYKLHEYGEAKAIELLQEHQMQVSSLHWAGGFTGSDGRSFREAILDGLDAVELAAELQASCLIVLAGSRGGHTKSHARRLLKDALKELGEAALARNVQLAVEPMHTGCAEDWTFLTELPTTLDIVGEVDNPNLGVAFDAYHLGQSTEIVEWLPNFASKIQLVQLGDAKSSPLGEQNRCLLGEGTIPLNQIIECLEGAGYSGYYELEMIGEDIEHLDYESILERSAATVRQWLGDLPR